MGQFTPQLSELRKQKAMAFIDGTNLFYRPGTAKLNLISLARLVRLYSQERIILRAYLYTTEPHYKAAIAIHGESAMGEIRIVMGQLSGSDLAYCVNYATYQA